MKSWVCLENKAGPEIIISMQSFSPCENSAARAWLERNLFLWFSLLSLMRELINAFNIRPFTHLNHTAMVGKTIPADLTKCQFINNFNLLSHIFSYSYWHTGKPIEFTFVTKVWSTHWSEKEKGKAINSSEAYLKICHCVTHDLDKISLYAGKDCD